MNIEINIDEKELEKIICERIAEKVIDNCYVARIYKGEVQFSQRLIREMVSNILSQNVDSLKLIVEAQTKQYIANSTSYKQGKLRKLIEEALKEEES